MQLMRTTPFQDCVINDAQQLEATKRSSGESCKCGTEKSHHLGPPERPYNAAVIGIGLEKSEARRVPCEKNPEGHPWQPGLTVQDPLFRVPTHNLKVLGFPRFDLDRRFQAPRPLEEAPESAFSSFRNLGLGCFLGFGLVSSRSQVNILKAEAWIEKPRKECHPPIVGIRLLDQPCTGKLNLEVVLGSTSVQ